jgi:L-amino acid N-acyltransferase YncA
LLNELLQKAKDEYALKAVYILLPQTRKSFRLIKKLGFELIGKETYCGQLFVKFMKQL